MYMYLSSRVPSVLHGLYLQAEEAPPCSRSSIANCDGNLAVDRGLRFGSGRMLVAQHLGKGEGPMPGGQFSPRTLARASIAGITSGAPGYALQRCNIHWHCGLLGGRSQDGPAAAGAARSPRRHWYVKYAEIEILCSVESLMGASANEGYELKCATEPLRLSKRASIDQITFTDPEWHHPVPTSSRTTLPRNLSYIRETSESNLGDDSKVRSQRPASPGHDGGNVAAAVLQLNRRHTTSTLSLPPSSLPERKSSRCILRRKASLALGLLNDAPALPLPPPRGSGQTIPSRGSAVSPVRLAVASLDDTSSEMRKIPSRTFVRSVRPVDIVEFPKLNHPRVALDLRVSSPLFMGGCTVEGSLRIALDGGAPGGRYKSRSAMSIGRVLVDVLGVESSHGKHWIFRSLACELIDETHPPPNTMAASTGAAFDAFWESIPSSSVLPFRLNLPVNMGPPPYRSKQARIRYIICATLAIKISGMQHCVRKSLEIAILSAHDRRCSVGI